MSSLLAYRSTLSEAPFTPAPPEAPAPLEITVLFTGSSSNGSSSKNVQYTLEALRKAAQLALGLHAHIRLVVPQVVPYPLPLTSPPVMLEFAERRFRMIAAQQAAENQPIEMRVEIYLCRDTDEMLDQVLKPKSMVIFGGAKHWWPAAEQRLARRLRRNGHEVIFVPSVANKNMKEDPIYA